MSTKLIFTIVSIIVHLGVGACAFFNQYNETAFWIAWFASFNATIGIYTAANVAINKQASSNYNPILAVGSCVQENITKEGLSDIFENKS